MTGPPLLSRCHPDCCLVLQLCNCQPTATPPLGLVFNVAGFYSASQRRRSCLPSASLDIFNSSCVQQFYKNTRLKSSAGLPLEGLDIFHHSCVQHSLRHSEGSLFIKSLPTTALDWFHFSAMRRLLHNSGKCLLPEAALEFWSGSLIQQAMASDLKASLESFPSQVSTDHSLLMHLALSVVY